MFIVGGQLADSHYKGKSTYNGDEPGYSEEWTEKGSDDVASYGAFLEYGNKYQTWKGWLDIYNSSNTPLFDIKVNYLHDKYSDAADAMVQLGYRFGINQYTQFDLLLNGGYQYINYSHDSDAWAKSAHVWKVGAGAGLNVMVDRYNVLRAEAGANYSVNGRIKMDEGENMDTDDKLDPYVELSWINQATRFAYITTLFYTRQSFNMDGQQTYSFGSASERFGEDAKRDIIGVRFGIGF
ncbi:hypothetical protein LMG33810_002629 [Carnimonas sp. LMG 33810]